MPRPSDLKRLQKEKINEARSARNFIDLSSNEDNDDSAKSIINHLLVASEASFKKNEHPKMYIGLYGLVLNCVLYKKKKANSEIINCCACQLIANQPNFLTEYGQIQKEIESKGHKAFNSISLERIRFFARLSFRWMDTYQHGLTEKVAEYVVKNNKRHRLVNEEIMNQ
ncbi:35695_t:CDS:2, partial [Gigaspora margarita]